MKRKKIHCNFKCSMWELEPADVKVNEVLVLYLYGASHLLIFKSSSSSSSEELLATAASSFCLAALVMMRVSRWKLNGFTAVHFIGRPCSSQNHKP